MRVFLLVVVMCFIFFFKQKTAYEMRISDWSSDVCSSDLHNSDGEEVVFHRVRFPFARGVTQALVGERLDTIPALQRETTHFWNWLDEEPNGIAKSTGRMAWGVTMADGTQIGRAHV